MLLIFKSTWQDLKTHWLQSLMLVLGIALGVGMIISIDLANESAQRAFQISTAAVQGSTSHRIEGQEGRLPESLFRDLRLKLGVRQSAPVVKGYVNWQGQSFQVLGVDPLSEAPFRSYFGSPASEQADLFPFISSNNRVLISQSFAHKHQLQAGSQISVIYKDQAHTLWVSAIVSVTDPLTSQSLNQVLFTDIGTAQSLLDMLGELSYIDLKLDQHPEHIEEIKAFLPATYRLKSTRTRNQELAQMTRAFEINLQALSLLALLVGMFLVYNTVSFSVVQRRPRFGTLRSLGVTRQEIFLLILIETLLVALPGIAMGLVLGVILGQGALELVTQTINDLYFKLQVKTLSLSPWTLFKGALMGGVAAIGAALIPAWEATQTPPAGVLKVSTLESQFIKIQPWLWFGGAMAIALGMGIIWLPNLGLTLSFFCFFLVVIGMTLWVPGLGRLFFTLATRIFSPQRTLLVHMACSGLKRHLSRTGIAIAALMVAVSVVISVSVMIQSFRSSVVDWLERILAADIYISAQDNQGTLSLDLKPKLEATPGVEAVEFVYNQRLATEAYGQVNLIVLSRDLARNRPFLWRQKSVVALWPGLLEGGLMISEPFARKKGIPIGPGQSLTLETKRGKVLFPILGVYRDYSTEQGTVVMASDVYQRYWRLKGVSSYGLILKSDADTEGIRNQLNQKYSSTYQLAIQSNQGLRAGAIQVFDRTFAITHAMRILAIVVAFMGIFSTLMAMQLDRRREMAILRALGLTPNQLRILIGIESLVLGAVAGILAVPLGIVLTIFLIDVINLRSFGWSMDLVLDTGVLLQGVVLAILASGIAGLIPAWRMGAFKPGEALKGE